MHFDLEFFLTLATLLAGLIAAAARLPFLARLARARGAWFFDGARSFFPVLLIVLLLRSFVVEPFRIPSSSMLPTLQIGDFILVNKYAYGLRLPVLHDVLIPMGEPRAGDVVVFRYPHDASQDYIKRIIGAPGDHIVYRDKLLYINGREIEQHEHVAPAPPASELMELQRKTEALPGARHDVLVAPTEARPSRQWRVPPGHYFVMGDNRDNSNDSRAWGFVPAANLVGRAFFIWMHWDYAAGRFEPSRIGEVIQ